MNDERHQVSRHSLSGPVRQCDPSDHIGSSIFVFDLLHHSKKKYKHVQDQQIALIPEYESTGTCFCYCPKPSSGLSILKGVYSVILQLVSCKW